MDPPDLATIPKGCAIVAILPALEVAADAFSRISRALMGIYP